MKGRPFVIWPIDLPAVGRIVSGWYEKIRVAFIWLYIDKCNPIHYTLT